MDWKPIRKLMLIDNDDINNFIVEELFKEGKVADELVISTGVTEGMNILGQKDYDFPDLIILDLNMPVLGGFDFISAYESKGYDSKATRIVILSSSLNKQDQERALEHSCVAAFMVKPIKIDELKKLAIELGISS